MSRIIWSEALIPDNCTPVREYRSEFYDHICLHKTKSLPIIESQAGLPSRRAYRSMNRTAVLLSIVGLKAKNILKKFLEENPFEVGIYCALENGSFDFESGRAMADISRENFGEIYKKFRNPKMYLKQLPNLSAAQMGIFLGLTGPLHVFNNSTWGSIHALHQAEIDLKAKRIRAAFVCSAFSFENPLIMERINQKCLDNRILCEGAGAMLLVGDYKENEWEEFDYANTDTFFGISHPLITQILDKEKSDMNDKMEFFTKIEESVRAVLNTEEGEIKMESLFRADLEAESIDFLDISFEIEKRTGIELDFPLVLEFLNQTKNNEIDDISIADLVEYLLFVKDNEQVN